MTPNDDRCFIDVDGSVIPGATASVVFDETYIHYAENKTDQNRIIFFADVERPLKPAGWNALITGLAKGNDSSQFTE